MTSSRRIASYLLCGFRIGQIMDGLKEKLETAYKASGGRKVNLISHSMGGLLVSCFISLYSDVCFIYLVNCWFCSLVFLLDHHGKFYNQLSDQQLLSNGKFLVYLKNMEL